MSYHILSNGLNNLTAKATDYRSRTTATAQRNHHMRLSIVHKEILLILYANVIRGGKTEPIGAIELFTKVNDSRPRPVPVTHFRHSCHTLITEGLIEKYRDEQMSKLVFRLSVAGISLAQTLHDGRHV